MSLLSCFLFYVCHVFIHSYSFISFFFWKNVFLFLCFDLVLFVFLRFLSICLLLFFFGFLLSLFVSVFVFFSCFLCFSSFSICCISFSLFFNIFCLCNLFLCSFARTCPLNVSISHKKRRKIQRVKKPQNLCDRFMICCSDFFWPKATKLIIPYW